MEEEYDAVVVCNGHYADPRVPRYPGQEQWGGQQMHSHNYRAPDPFKGAKVVVVGVSASGEDISREIGDVADKASPLPLCPACALPALPGGGALVCYWLPPPISLSFSLLPPSSPYPSLHVRAARKVRSWRFQVPEKWLDSKYSSFRKFRELLLPLVSLILSTFAVQQVVVCLMVLPSYPCPT